MSVFKPYRGTSANLNSLAKKDGNVYFCVDTATFWVDYLENGVVQRKQFYPCDSLPVENSNNHITSGAVYTALNDVVGDIDTVLGNLLDGTSVAEVNEILDEINGEVA